MIVRELIALLETMPPDALVIHTFCSDFEEIDPEDIRLMPGKLPDGGGLILHHGHLMEVKAGWLPKDPDGKVIDPEYVTAVHFRGN